MTHTSLDSYRSAMNGAQALQAEINELTGQNKDPLTGLSPRAIEVFEADYKASTHRRTKCSKADFAAGWRTAMELHGGVIWKTLNRDKGGRG